ncbi:MAG TPA: CbiX/SirB N-terminal domain-containing protein [Candidatus Acidoferrales bacterium]|nr:CbiX/SirB N-terminal domain-containing protein [Candidatus Acidoferrales bacterium]
MTTGVIVFAHGSRIESANEAVRAVAADLARESGHPHVLAAFLELGDPALETAAARLAAAGADRIVILPYFLTLGLHMERDLPRIRDQISAAHPGMKVLVAPPLDGHPALARILADRLREAVG